MSTLGLNMIVGAGEAYELDRCLKSLQADEVFDQIVIVRTTGDEAVKQVAEKWTKDTKYQPWADEEYPDGNFARARNAALDLTTTDYVWTMDADDVIEDRYKEKYLKFANEIIKSPANISVEAYFVPYAVESEINGIPKKSFLYARVFKRTKRMRWHRATHECIRRRWEGVNQARVLNFAVTHRTMKPVFSSADRDVRILEREYQKSKNDRQMCFFYARALMGVGRQDEGIAIMESLIQTMGDDFENMYAVCYEVAMYYAYGAAHSNPMPDSMIYGADGNPEAERWLRMAIAFGPHYAEPLLVLGDLYLHKGEVKAAEILYRRALHCKLGTGMLQAVPFYEELPANRLAEIYINEGRFEEALWYNKRAMTHNKDSEILLNQRERIMEGLNGHRYTGQNADACGCKI